MPHEVPPAAHDHVHHQPAGWPHGHAPADLPAGSAGDEAHLAALPSPLWWSAPLRLACAVVLSAALWLVIAWALA